MIHAATDKLTRPRLSRERFVLVLIIVLVLVIVLDAAALQFERTIAATRTRRIFEAGSPSLPRFEDDTDYDYEDEDEDDFRRDKVLDKVCDKVEKAAHVSIRSFGR